VLSPWSAAAQPLVKLKVDKCTELVETYVTAGIEQAMNMFNKLEFSL
jgi:peptidyl-tRNA hydrolase, PTH1 family